MNKREKPEATTREKKVKRVKTQIRTTPSVSIDPFVAESEETYDQCHLKFKEICGRLRELFHLIYLSKTEIGNEAEIKEYMLEVCILIIKLKKLNRLDKHQWKKSRDAVSDFKVRIDGLNLQYQNLLYEVTHLQKEEMKCLEFKSKDEEIDLVPVEEFYRDAPISISKPEITKNDNHELTMARLHWEFEQRRRNGMKLKEAEVKKGEYTQNIKKLKETLSSVQPVLQSILEATEPLQTKICMPLQSNLAIHKPAKYLPNPLYVIYVETYAYKVACDKKIKISIEGNVDEAKVLKLKNEILSEDSGESDQEETSNRHRHSVSSRKEDSSRDILKKHPMSVVIAVEDHDKKMTLEFSYLVQLHLVTVVVKSILQSSAPISPELIGPLMNLDTFLNCLFPNDTGKETPNLANKYFLRKLGEEECPFSKETGWPYAWVQKFGGQKCLDKISETSKQDCLFTEKVFHAIRTRLTARTQLSHQIGFLEQGTNIPPKFAAIYPTNISSQLKKWHPVPLGEVKVSFQASCDWNASKCVTLQSHPSYSDLLQLNVVSDNVLLYNAEVQRGSAFLSVLVVVHPDYPIRTPVLLLRLNWKGYHTSASSNALRELEEEVNIHFIESFSEEFKPSLLICQLYHLAVCFDVFLETESSVESLEGPREFVQEKVVARPARGRSHSRPYKCASSQGFFIHR